MFVLGQNLTDMADSSMLHSITVDPLLHDIYLTKLPGNTPPLKFYPTPPPPPRNLSVCTDNPPKWPMLWNAMILLTPYSNKSSLMTAQVFYSAHEKAMYVQLDGHDSKFPSDTLTINDQTYSIERDNAGSVKCQQWKTPTPHWLSGCKCKCQGTASGGQALLWQCPDHDFVDWFWFNKTTNKPWRIFLNNSTNPSMLYLS